jgi:acid phosphatase type 7
MRKTTAYFLALFAALHASGADKVVGGPYVVNVRQTSATVMWVVETSQGTLHAEKLPLTGLRSGKTFDFDTKAGEDGKGSFKTAPSGPDAFQFVVYGDTRTRHDMHRRVVAAILKFAAPDFVMHTGDLVSNGADSSQWPVFFDIERELLRKTAFFPSLGNHERNDPQYYEFFGVTTPYYSFDWGSSHFIVLNSDVGNVSAATRESYWNEQVHWLKDDLEKSQSADSRFLVAHHPPITAVSNRQGNNPHMTALMPMFEKYKLTAGFFGHDHNYQHYLKNGVHYFVTGGGGAPLYNVDKPPAGITLKVESTEHFVVVKVEGKTARVEALRLDGQPLEVTTLNP